MLPAVRQSLSATQPIVVYPPPTAEADDHQASFELVSNGYLVGQLVRWLTMVNGNSMMQIIVSING